MSFYVRSFYEKTTLKISNFIKEDFYGFAGLVFFALFFVHASIFYLECIAYQDYAWEATYFLNKDGFNLVYFRWGSLPWRLFLIIGPYIGLSLNVALLLTSIWFVFLKFVLWYVCHFIFKNTYAGLLVIFSILFFGGEGYYAQGWQAHNASLYVCLFFAIININNSIKGIWVKMFLLVLLIVLIKFTYSALLMVCPLIIIFSNNGYKFKALFFLFSFATILLFTIFLTPPYESNIFSSMVYIFKHKSFRDINGLFFYFIEQIVDLTMFFPIWLFFFTLVSLWKYKKFITILVYSLFIFFLTLLIVSKLGTYKCNYPLSRDVNYYVQGALFLIYLPIVIALLMVLEKYNSKVIDKSVIKLFMLFIIVVYSSKIFSAGLKHKELTSYTKFLVEKLSEKYNSSFYIINPDLIPHRFAKLNMNVEYETLLKSSVFGSYSTSILITPYVNPLNINDEFPVFVNIITSIETSREVEIDYNRDLIYKVDTAEHKELKHFKFINPNKYFKNFNPHYFKFRNFNYTIVSKEDMNRINKNFGFSISDYCCNE